MPPVIAEESRESASSVASLPSSATVSLSPPMIAESSETTSPLSPSPFSMLSGVLSGSFGLLPAFFSSLSENESRSVSLAVGSVPSYASTKSTIPSPSVSRALAASTASLWPSLFVSSTAPLMSFFSFLTKAGVSVGLRGSVPARFSSLSVAPSKSLSTEKGSVPSSASTESVNPSPSLSLSKAVVRESDIPSLLASASPSGLLWGSLGSVPAFNSSLSLAPSPSLSGL
mmetsp:Transcript_24890/g.54276  ORF Transcript_24890/g.54276 Transcript_24890/m.54276 type:complete len:229 (-) Transcript_24890:244-930(-)